MTEKLQTLKNRYVLQELLGAGGMGEVYRALDRLTGQDVALKMVLPTKVTHKVEQAHSTTSEHLALVNEFKTLARLRHPHIVNVLDYGFTQDKQPFFTLPLIQHAQTIVEAGADLDDMGKVKLIIQLLQALAYLHRHGLVHRDIKPTNILVDTHQNVWVVDFGIVIHFQEEVEQMAGTMYYMAPELLEGGTASFTSDLYSVGVLAYEMLTGQHPFKKESGQLVMELMEAIRKEQPDLAYFAPHDDRTVQITATQTPVLPLASTQLPQISLRDIMGRLLAKDPQTRYGNALEVIKALCQAMQIDIPPETEAIRESFLQAAPLIGREAELTQLKDALAGALDRQGSLWLIGGESGIGKSRLVNELRTHALVNGALVVTGQGLERGLRYQAWRDMLPQLILETEISDLEAGILRPLVPNIEQLLNRPISTPPDLPGKAGRERLYNTIYDVLSRQKQSVVLILEDLQWAVESVDTLSFLQKYIEALPILIVGTYRQEQAHVAEKLTEAKYIHLLRFAEQEVTALSQAMLGEVADIKKIVDLLMHETEGNIFFIVEVVRAFAETAGSLQNISADSIPTKLFTGGMHQLVQRRIDQLSEQYRPVLNLAAVSGRHLNPALLQHLSTEVFDLNSFLYTCAQNLILEPYENGWRFAHDKLREGILRDLSDGERAHLHEQVALGIEYLYPANSNYNDVLMHHWRMAGNTGKELMYLREVVQNYIVHETPETALTLIEHGFELAQDDKQAQMHFYKLAGMAHRQVSHIHQAYQFLNKGLDLAHELNAIRMQAELYIELSKVDVAQSEYPLAHEKLQTALQMARQLDYTEAISDVFHQLGNIAYFETNYTEAGEYYQQALDLRHQLNDPLGIARTLNNLANVYRNQGNQAITLELHKESLAIKQRIGDKRGIASSYHNLGLISAEQGDLQGAENYYEQALTLWRAYNIRHGVSQTLINLGHIKEDLGQFEAAHQCYAESMFIQRESGDKLGLSYSLTGLGSVAQYWGNRVEAEQYYEESLQLSRTINYEFGVATSLKNLGTVAMDKADYAKALSLLRESLEIYQKLAQHKQVIHVLYELTRLAIQTEHLGEALEYTEQNNEVAKIFDVLQEKLPVMLSILLILEKARYFELLAGYLGAVQTHFTLVAEYQPLVERLQSICRANLDKEQFAKLYQNGTQADINAMLGKVSEILALLKNTH